MSDDPRDVIPPDPHADRLNNARERMVADYDEPEPQRRSAASLAGGLIPKDKTTRYLTWGALGLGGFLVLGIGSWSLLSHNPGGIPVIGPPPAPVRDEPANPGGMEANDVLPTDDSTADGKTHVLPKPEQPDPAALTAQYGAKKEDTAPAAAPLTQPESGSAQNTPADQTAPADKADGKADQPEEIPATPDAASQADSEPAAATNKPADKPAEKPAAKPAEARKPAAPPAAAKRKPAAAASPAKKSSASAGGNYGVQLAALNSEAAALQEWTRIKEALPDLVGSHTPVIEKVSRDSTVFYRLRTRNFSSLSEAQTFCSNMRSHGHACTPLRP